MTSPEVATQTLEEHGHETDSTSRVVPQTCAFTLSNGLDVTGLSWPNHKSELPPVLLVHGLASNAHLWKGVGEILHMIGHHVVAINLRGHHRSSKPATGYDVGTVAREVAEVIEAAELDRPILAGQSWGGNVALQVAANDGLLIRALACIDGGFYDLSKTYKNWAECKKDLTPPAFEDVDYDDLAQYFAREYKNWPPVTRLAALESFERLENGKARPWLTMNRHLQTLKGMWLHHPIEVAPHVQVPTLFVTATESSDDDEMNPNEKAVTELVEVMPQASALSYYPAHHDIHAQHPEIVADAINSLVDGVSQRCSFRRVNLHG